MSSLENDLFLQIIVVLLSMLVFAIILESFGFVLQKIVAPLLRQIDKAPSPNNGLIIRTFTGGLFYTLVFLALGEARLLTKAIVLCVSLAVPVLAFILGQRWNEVSPKRLKPIFKDNTYIILGAAAFGLLTFIFWFRPTTDFDGIWYHLTIPKLFLQNHDVRNQGGLILYSLQPSMDYFWNLLPLSLPIPTAVASIIVNGGQAFIVCMSLGFASKIGKKVWGWNNWQQFIVPILLGFSFEGVSLLGIGGNDLLGLAYGLVATLYCFYLLTKPKVTWSQLTYGLILIVGLATVKVFFTVYACMVLVYLLAGSWDKLPDIRKPKKQLLKLVRLLLIIFVITYLPWLLRAYIATGRPFDPLGIPGLNAMFYINQGGGTAVNHWTNFVFTRLYSSIGQMLFFVYSPLVLVGVLSVFHKTIRAKATNLWLLAFLGFWVVFFASITLAWRYYLPEATILAFLGIATVIELNKNFDLFGHLAVWGVIGAIVVTTGLRVIYTSSSTAAATVTDASIQGIIYVRHFTGTDNYLNKEISPSYSYVQEQSPRGLSPTEKLFIGNTYQPIPLLVQPVSSYDLLNIHNLAYVHNPVLESTMNPKAFENIKTVSQFVSVLKSNHIRYILSRKSMSQVCQFVGVQNPLTCANPAVFKTVLVDNAWDVTWYKLAGT
jgi:hypothetical protein